jgi:hypothetical protein
VLSVGHGEPQGLHAVVAVEGPLRLYAWCEGPQDGFTLERCDGRPHWAVTAARSGSAVCRRHVRSIPGSLNRDRERLTDFQARAAAGLSQRYGVDVHIGVEAPTPEVAGHPQESIGRALEPKPRRVRFGLQDRSS